MMMRLNSRIGRRAGLIFDMLMLFVVAERHDLDERPA
jgi:hypothetical protein